LVLTFGILMLYFRDTRGAVPNRRNAYGALGQSGSRLKSSGLPLDWGRKGNKNYLLKHFYSLFGFLLRSANFAS
ncbi:MAG: hypothetical protein J0H29_01040, partial [Sphingobacteriales bacterium]|nr:hypothetical protein [Sphingobacteriales bacterium]